MKRQIQDDALYEIYEENAKELKKTNEYLGCMGRMLIGIAFILVLIFLK